MYVNWKRGIIALFLLLAFSTDGVVFAGPNDLAKQADKITRNAERQMHNGKNEQALTLLNEAAELIQQVKTEDPGNKFMIRVEKQYERVKQNVDKKLAKTNPPGASSVAQAKKSTPASNKLPGGVTKRLKDISRHLDSAEEYATENAKRAKYKLSEAQELFNQIEKNYGGKYDPAHPDYADVQNRFNEITAIAERQGTAEDKAKTAATGSKEAMEKQSAEWVPKFNQYLSYAGQEGYNPDKYVFVPGTSEPEKFAEAQKRYDEFKAFYEEYKQAEFPNGMSGKLKDLAENQAPLRIKDFEEGFASRVDYVAGSAGKEIATAMKQLEKDNGWKSDKNIKPEMIDHKWMASIKESVEKTNSALAASDPKRKEVQAQFESLVAMDNANRQIRKERTFMMPDRYPGKDIAQLKRKAESLVKNNKKEGGKPLRCTVISEGWQLETVEEWTDTSKTVWRSRTTRSLTSQVAAKTSDGVRLITVALAQDKQSDGKWGPLYGNLHQYSDPMLEENVNM